MFNATRNLAQKFGAKFALAGGALVPVLARAQATDPVSQIFAAVDLTTVSVAVIAVGLLVIAIVMAFKGIDLGKRAVSKA